MELLGTSCVAAAQLRPTSAGGAPAFLQRSRAGVAAVAEGRTPRRSIDAKRGHRNARAGAAAFGEDVDDDAYDGRAGAWPHEDAGACEAAGDAEYDGAGVLESVGLAYEIQTVAEVAVS